MGRKKVHVKRSGSDLAFDIISYLILGIVSFDCSLSAFCCYSDCFHQVLPGSGKCRQGYAVPNRRNAGRIPEKLFEDSRIFTGYRNTILYTAAGTTLDLCLTLITAYPLMTFKKLPGRKIFTGFFLFTMFFNGGLIPTFLLIKGLGLYDTPFVLVLLGALNIYNMIIARSFFEGTISKDLMDAAEIDGCGKFRFFSFRLFCRYQKL